MIETILILIAVMAISKRAKYGDYDKRGNKRRYHEWDNDVLVGMLQKIETQMQPVIERLGPASKPIEQKYIEFMEFLQFMDQKFVQFREFDRKVSYFFDFHSINRPDIYDGRKNVHCPIDSSGNPRWWEYWEGNHGTEGNYVSFDETRREYDRRWMLHHYQTSYRLN